jgi:hypothetical protein
MTAEYLVVWKAVLTVCNLVEKSVASSVVMKELQMVDSKAGERVETKDYDLAEHWVVSLAGH